MTRENDKTLVEFEGEIAIPIETLFNDILSFISKTDLE